MKGPRNETRRAKSCSLSCPLVENGTKSDLSVMIKNACFNCASNDIKINYYICHFYVDSICCNKHTITFQISRLFEEK